MIRDPDSGLFLPESFVGGAVIAAGGGGPSAKGLPAAAGGSATPWFEEDWSSYADTTALLAEARHTEDAPSGEITLATGLTTPWGGTKAVRRAFTTDTGTVGLTVTLPDGATDQLQELWIEVWLYTELWSQGSGDKTIFLLDQDSNRWTIIEMGLTGGPIAATSNAPGVDADNPHGNPYWRKVWPETDPWDKSDFEGHTSWRRLRWQCRMGPGTPTGIIKVSIDEVLAYVADDGDTTDGVGDYWNAMKLGANSAAVSGAEMLYGRIVAYDQDPSWSEFA